MKYRITQTNGQADETYGDLDSALARVKEIEGWDDLYTVDVQDCDPDRQWTAYLCYESEEDAEGDDGADVIRVVEDPEHSDDPYDLDLARAEHDLSGGILLDLGYDRTDRAAYAVVSREDALDYGRLPDHLDSLAPHYDETQDYACSCEDCA